MKLKQCIETKLSVLFIKVTKLAEYLKCIYNLSNC